jgi:hypothetical protein
MAKKVQLEVEIKGNDSVAQASEKTKALKENIQKLKETLATGGLGEKEYQKASDQLQKYEERLKKTENTTKSMTQELRQLTMLIASGKLKGEELINAQMAAGKLKDAIADAKQEVNNFASDTRKLDAFLTLGQGIAGGFAAAQGAMALFGSENDEIQKSLLKVQSAVAVLNGLQAVHNTINKSSALITEAQSIKLKVLTFLQARYTAAVGLSTGAMKAMRIVGMTLGIGVIVAAVGLLIANFDKVKSVVMGVVDRFKGLSGTTKNILSVMFPFIGVIRLVYAGLEKLGAFAETAADRYEKLEKANQKQGKQMQREIDLMEAQGASARELYLAKHKMLMLEYETMEAKRKLIGLTTEEQEAQKDLANSINILNAEETKRQNDDAKKRQDDANKANEEAAKKRKEAQDKKKQAQDKADEEEKRKREEIDKLIADEEEAKRLRGKSQMELELMDLQKALEKKQELIGNDFEKQKLLTENYEKDVAALNEKYRLEQEEKNKEIKAKKDEDDLAEKARIKELADFELEKKQNLEDAKLGIANQSAQFLQQIAGKQKGIALAALAIEKGAAIADVIIQGQRANAKLTALYPAPANVPFIAANNIRTALSVATIAATGIQGAKNITGGGSGGGGSVQPPNIRGSQTTNEPTSQPATKVFVTETDIRSVTRKVDGIFTQATIQ